MPGCGCELDRGIGEGEGLVLLNDTRLKKVSSQHTRIPTHAMKMTTSGLHLNASIIGTKLVVDDSKMKEPGHGKHAYNQRYLPSSGIC